MNRSEDDAMQKPITFFSLANPSKLLFTITLFCPWMKSGVGVIDFLTHFSFRTFSSQ